MRIEQLDRMGWMIKESEAALQSAIARDFKTASQAYTFATAASLLETVFQKGQLKVDAQEAVRFCHIRPHDR
jgi:aldehyde dehydrogenase (NAD+)